MIEIFARGFTDEHWNAAWTAKMPRGWRAKYRIWRIADGARGDAPEIGVECGECNRRLSTMEPNQRYALNTARAHELAKHTDTQRAAIDAARRGRESA